MARFIVNGKAIDSAAAPDTPLLWVLREDLGLTGTKFGCGIGQCGACTVHVDGTAAKSCQLPVSAVEGMTITTIEGLSDDSTHPLQVAWIEEQVPQCGYCQNGQILTAKALLERNPDPSDAEIREAMDGTLCRCMTYYRVQKAIRRAARAMAAGAAKPRP